MLKIKLLTFLLLTSTLSFKTFGQQDFTFKTGNDLHVSINDKEASLVKTAFEMFCSDYQRVFNAKVHKSTNAKVYIASIGMGSEIEKMLDSADYNWLKNKSEGFLIQVHNGNLIVLGSDKRGTAYGILEISRLIGVSPWEWWADSAIETKNKITLKKDFKSFQSPSVKHRGIFINDEDWGLTPWA